MPFELPGLGTFANVYALIRGVLRRGGGGGGLIPPNWGVQPTWNLPPKPPPINIGYLPPREPPLGLPEGAIPLPGGDSRRRVPAMRTCADRYHTDNPCDLGEWNACIENADLTGRDWFEECGPGPGGPEPEENARLVLLDPTRIWGAAPVPKPPAPRRRPRRKRAPKPPPRRRSPGTPRPRYPAREPGPGGVPDKPAPPPSYPPGVLMPKVWEKLGQEIIRRLEAYRRLGEPIRRGPQQRFPRPPSPPPIIPPSIEPRLVPRPVLTIPEPRALPEPMRQPAPAPQPAPVPRSTPTPAPSASPRPSPRPMPRPVSLLPYLLPLLPDLLRAPGRGLEWSPLPLQPTPPVPRPPPVPGFPPRPLTPPQYGTLSLPGTQPVPVEELCRQCDKSRRAKRKRRKRQNCYKRVPTKCPS